MIACKRAYEPPQTSDGTRVLVDRLWPRGVKKEALQLSQWLKEVAPTDELRRAFGHEPEHFPAFKEGYLKELNAHPEHWQALFEMAEKGTLTLIYAAHDEQLNNARVLAEFLEAELERRGPPSSPTCYDGLV